MFTLPFLPGSPAPRALRNSFLCSLSSLIAFASISWADTTSLTGTLLNPEDTAQIAFALATPGTVTLQTYGFGGGTNAAGTNVPAGGFDPFVGLFSGIGDTAVFIDGTSDILSDYSPGCPPAGTVTIGSVGGQCGDVALQFTGLAAGAYILLVSDGAYIPNAVFEAPGGTLGDGFTDLTGGVFQTCVDASDCNTDTANWAVDLTTSGGASPAPELGTGWLVGCACLAALLVVRKRRVATKGGLIR
jgi:hypothetical protein